MTLYLIGTVAGLAWMAYVFWQAWQYGEMDWKMLGIILTCFVLVSWLSYGSRGYHEDGTPTYCGSGPTSYEC